VQFVRAREELAKFGHLIMGAKRAPALRARRVRWNADILTLLLHHQLRSLSFQGELSNVRHIPSIPSNGSIVFHVLINENILQNRFNGPDSANRMDHALAAYIWVFHVEYSILSLLLQASQVRQSVHLVSFRTEPMGTRLSANAAGTESATWNTSQNWIDEYSSSLSEKVQKDFEHLNHLLEQFANLLPHKCNSIGAVLPFENEKLQKLAIWSGEFKIGNLNVMSALAFLLKADQLSDISLRIQQMQIYHLSYSCVFRAVVSKILMDLVFGSPPEALRAFHKTLEKGFSKLKSFHM